MAKLKQRLITISGGLSPATDAWQVGAKTPPKSCLCCGRSFDTGGRRRRGPYQNGPYLYVCQQCWALPFVFFPDKKLAKCGECWIPREKKRHHHIASRDRMQKTKSWLTQGSVTRADRTEKPVVRHVKALGQ